MSVAFTDAALDDLRRFGPALARRTVEQVALLDADPELGRELVAGCGFRVLIGAGGALRIVYALGPGGSTTVWELWIDGVRTEGTAYAEALHRMQSADAPEAVEHAQLLERLGRLTGTVPVPPARVREPVPDWLADVVLDAGLTDRVELAGLDATTAFARWNAREGG